jgi:hypothetical protein
LVEPGFLLADPARPQSVDQDPGAIFLFGRLISALDFDVRGDRRHGENIRLGWRGILARRFPNEDARADITKAND